MHLQFATRSRRIVPASVRDDRAQLPPGLGLGVRFRKQPLEAPVAKHLSKLGRAPNHPITEIRLYRPRSKY
eukprot:4380466-Pyramimonas_sp.AAC.1